MLTVGHFKHSLAVGDKEINVLVKFIYTPVLAFLKKS